MKPHKHCELIKAWADGSKIQVHTINGWEDIQIPTWWGSANYRVKPELKQLWVRPYRYSTDPSETIFLLQRANKEGCEIPHNPTMVWMGEPVLVWEEK